MSEMKLSAAKRASLSSRVSLCGERAITIAGQTFVPDKYSAYIEFHLAHAFPVVTCDSTALHPQVVANSYRSLLNKVFNLGHIMVANNPEQNARDRILGTIVGVEYPEPLPGGWTVGALRRNAPGIRAVAVVHRQAEGVEHILRTHFNGKVHWTVSMEQDFYVDAATESIAIDSGFIVRGAPAELVRRFDAETPPDLERLGWTYVSCLEAPEELQRCFTISPEPKCARYRGCETVLLFGGLNNSVQFKGTALTPLGREAEARVAQMLAAQALFDEDILKEETGRELFACPLAGLLPPPG